MVPRVVAGTCGRMHDQRCICFMRQARRGAWRFLGGPAASFVEVAVGAVWAAWQVGWVWGFRRGGTRLTRGLGGAVGVLSALPLRGEPGATGRVPQERWDLYESRLGARRQQRVALVWP
jgi:hypothetical protein